MQPEPPPGFEPPEVAVPDDVEARLRELMAEEERLLAELELKIEVNGILMTRQEWKEYMEECPHEHFSHPGVELMDGSKMSICDRCKFIQHEAIAKMIEKETTDADAREQTGTGGTVNSRHSRTRETASHGSRHMRVPQTPRRK